MMYAKTDSPYTIKKGTKQEVTYDRWGSPFVGINNVNGKFMLTMSFKLYSADGKECMSAVNNFTCSDMLGDETLGPLARELFKVVAEKAFKEGVLY